MIYTWGKGIPPIVCALLQVTEIDLEPGEHATEKDVDVGDDEFHISVHKGADRVGEFDYLIIKPTVANVETTLTVGHQPARVLLPVDRDPNRTHCPDLFYLPGRRRTPQEGRGTTGESQGGRGCPPSGARPQQEQSRTGSTALRFTGKRRIT